MSTEKNFWKSVNPLAERPSLFPAIFTGLFLVAVIMIISGVISYQLAPRAYQNSHFVIIFIAITFMLWTITRKFIYIERTWWQSLMMYGSFWCILFTGMILSMLAAKHFELV